MNSLALPKWHWGLSYCKKIGIWFSQLYFRYFKRKYCLLLWAWFMAKFVVANSSLLCYCAATSKLSIYLLLFLLEMPLSSIYSCHDHNIWNVTFYLLYSLIASILLILLKFNFCSKLQKLHKELVASGKLTESEFWATKKVKVVLIIYSMFAKGIWISNSPGAFIKMIELWLILWWLK
jgi:hypothetical protein